VDQSSSGFYVDRCRLRTRRVAQVVIGSTRDRTRVIAGTESRRECSGCR
jgi:hypothetical protein